MFRKLFISVIPKRSLHSIGIRRTKDEIVQNQKKLCYSTGLMSSNDDQNYDISDELMNSFDTQVLKRDNATKHLLTLKFKHFFDCTEKEAKEILAANLNLLKLPLSKITGNIEYLFEKSVSPKSILENPFLLGMSTKYLNIKLNYLESFQPKNINDFIPLIRVAPTRLLALQNSMRKERNRIPEGNRIYYFTKKLEVEPELVCKYFSTHMFMFDIQFDMLAENLNILMEYKVQPINILRDLWAFKYLPKSVKMRLDRAQKAQKEKMMPWMVRCPEQVLQKSLKLSVDSRNCLGEHQSVVAYLSERLGYDLETTQQIANKHVAILKVRVTKIKEILDYLLEEEHFERFEIAQVPRILSHSLDTTRKRINELKGMGCRPSSLVIVCKSQNEYNKFIRSWLENRKKRQERKDECWLV